MMATGLAARRAEVRMTMHAMYLRILAAPRLRIQAVLEVHAVYAEVPVEGATFAVEIVCR